MTKQQMEQFKEEFQKSVTQLEKNFGVNISLDTIRFNTNELRTKITATKGKRGEIPNKDYFKVGDIVEINHPKVNPNDQYRVIEPMNTYTRVEKLNGRGTIKVLSSLLLKLQNSK